MLRDTEIAALINMKRSDYERHVKMVFHEELTGYALWAEMASAIFQASEQNIARTDTIDRAVLRRAGFYNLPETEETQGRKKRGKVWGILSRFAKMI